MGADPGHLAAPIENYPYLDPFARETVTFARKYQVRGKRSRFEVTDNGSLHVVSGAQRCYEGPVGFRFLVLFTGRASLLESYDDEAEVFRIDLQVCDPVFGFAFGYAGWFRCEFRATTDAPAELKPVRHESRL